MKRFIAAMTAVIMLLALACTPALALSVRDAALGAALNVPDGNIQFVTEGEYPWTVDGANGWAKSTNFQSAVPNPPSRQQSRRKRAISFPLTTKSAAKHAMTNSFPLSTATPLLQAPGLSSPAKLTGRM